MPVARSVSRTTGRMCPKRGLSRATSDACVRGEFCLAKHLDVCVHSEVHVSVASTEMQEELEELRAEND